MKINPYEQLLGILDTGNKAVMLTSLKDYQKIVYSEAELSTMEENEALPIALAQKALETGVIQYDGNGEGVLAEPYYPEPHLVILGGGHIAKPLVELGKKVGFKVTVVDDRPFFANPGRFPEADRVICENFEEVFDQLNLNKASYVVIVTRGHRHDLVCLRKTLKYTTAYMGMIGSKRRVNSVREMMVEEGFPKELVDQVHAPIGIDIGAVTPEEIAISIIAEVISSRRKGQKTATGRRNWPEFDREVVENLVQEEGTPRSIVTILSSKGSVPRKAGAKMLVWPGGKILGSIGGGCSEAEVITLAYDVALKGVHQIKTVDMTGEVAEEEGMVCGGTMEVLIEPWSRGEIK